ncbi:MAG: collagenase [Gammaproteobacteria bacterium]|nr:collagenase [Gammaproteobacteria bacterium]
MQKPLAWLILAGWAGTAVAAPTATAPVSLLPPEALAAVSHAALPELAPAEHGQARKTLAAPQTRRSLPPSAALSDGQRDPHARRASEPGWTAEALTASADCRDAAGFRAVSGTALADYLESLPELQCTYGLFSLTAEDAAAIYSTGNFLAVAERLQARAAGYAATGRAVANLVLYLRAGYYDALSREVLPEPPASVRDSIRIGVARLLDNPALFIPNPDAGSTAGETLTLTTNTHDEAYYLPRLKGQVQRYTNRAAAPAAVDALKSWEASSGYTGVLSAIYLSHYRPEGRAIAESDGSYAQVLFDFAQANKAALLGTDYAYQLKDSLNEALRYMQYPAHFAASKARVKTILAENSLNGPGADLWLTAAGAVKYYDGANCAEYGTCNYEQQLADTVLPLRHECGATLRIRAQDMTVEQLQQSCQILAAEEGYFHRMLKTQNRPVANDNNQALEVVVFDDYANYQRYAGVIYDIATDNGGMYLEGNPADPSNQARFIAHEASWLRPTFSVWNLEHEYVHYLDGRYDMAGDFARGVSQPTVWWIEGVAEYLSLKNDNQKAIDAAKAGTYALSTIFGNTYGMSDYTNRAYRWGYMAVRYMVEKHRDVVDASVAKFRADDYEGYWSAMQALGTGHDADFAAWVQTATTAGTPPEPGCGYPNDQVIDPSCARTDLAASALRWYYVFVPVGTTRLTVKTSGGTGDADLYVKRDGWPSRNSYDRRSVGWTNAETIAIDQPTGGAYYHIAVDAWSAYQGLSLSVELVK